MRLRTVSFACGVLFSCIVANAQFRTDVLVGGAVTAGDVMVSSELKDINKKKEIIAASEMGILASLETIREYEEKTFKYLKTVNGAIRNAYDINRCGKLATQIADNLRACTKAASHHPQGAVVSTLVSKRYSTIIQESTGLVGYIGSLVTKGGENNLLNSAERNKILSTVIFRLSTINRQLVGLRYDIEMFRWTHVVRGYEPIIWAEMANADYAYKRARRNIKRLAEKF